MKNSSLPKTDHLIGNLLQKKRNRNRHFGCWRNLFWLSSYKCYSNYLTMSQNRNNRHPRLVISLLVSCLIGGKTQNSSGACNKVLILSSFNGGYCYYCWIYCDSAFHYACVLLSERGSLCKIVHTWQFGLWTQWCRWCLHMSSLMRWCMTAAWAGACPSPAPHQNSTLTLPHITLVGVDTCNIELFSRSMSFCQVVPGIAVAFLCCSGFCLCGYVQTFSWNIFFTNRVDWLFFFFHATDATCLLNSGIVHLTCSGYQKEVSFWSSHSPHL